MRKLGKIKSIPVGKKRILDSHVINSSNHIFSNLKDSDKAGWIIGDRINGAIGLGLRVSELSVLVVEYEVSELANPRKTLTTIQLPLMVTQWQDVIDHDLVDSDRTLMFERVLLPNEYGQKKEVAKVVLPRKELYCFDELEDIVMEFGMKVSEGVIPEGPWRHTFRKMMNEKYHISPPKEK